MNSDVHFERLETSVSKAWSVEAQAELVRGLVPKYLRYATEIRNVILSTSTAALKLQLDLSDGEIILLALVSTIGNDIASVPDAKRRADLLVTHRRLASSLGLEPTDVHTFTEHSSTIARILVG